MLQNWNCFSIAKNSNITINDIENNPEYDWNYSYISCNLNLSEALGTPICPELAVTEDFINKHLNEK